jgi:hypothetical protein
MPLPSFLWVPRILTRAHHAARGAPYRVSAGAAMVSAVLSRQCAAPPDGSEINVVTVPVINGAAIVADYVGYREHTVVRGETLSGTARQHFGDSGSYR